MNWATFLEGKTGLNSSLRKSKGRYFKPLWTLFAVCFLSTVPNTSIGAECPSDWPKNLPCPKEPWETVGLEHKDRVSRLKRLADGHLKFEFFVDEISPTEHGIENFPAPIPILRVVAAQDVFFDSGSDIIRPEAYRLLDIIADNLRREPPDVSLFVAGHTDWNGSVKYNFDLGLRRAHSVAAALVRRGIYQASVYRVSFGELLPIEINTTALGRSRNRRVEFLFGAHRRAIVQHLARQKIAHCDDDINREFGGCRTPIRIPAERIVVPQKHQKRILDLSNAQKRIESDERLTPVELEHERSAIESERERIPIQIPRERVEIILDPL